MICSTCISSFFMNGNKCVTNFNFGFNIVLTTTFSAFYSNYNSFLLQLAQSIGSNNPNIITLNTLTSSSVITNGVVTVTTADTSTATNQFNSLENTLKSGTVGNMPVNSYNVMV